MGRGSLTTIQKYFRQWKAKALLASIYIDNSPDVEDSVDLGAVLQEKQVLEHTLKAQIDKNMLDFLAARDSSLVVGFPCGIILQIHTDYSQALLIELIKFLQKF